MKLDTRIKLFGSRRRTELILLLELLEESYATEMARLLGARLFSVQSILEDLEREGIVVSRIIGRERRVMLNPRLAWAKELQALAQKVSEGDARLQSIVATRRTRPRRKGKTF